MIRASRSMSSARSLVAMDQYLSAISEERFFRPPRSEALPRPRLAVMLRPAPG